MAFDEEYGQGRGNGKKGLRKNMEALIQEVAEKNIPGLIEALKLEMKSAARML